VLLIVFIVVNKISIYVIELALEARSIEEKGRQQSVICHL